MELTTDVFKNEVRAAYNRARAIISTPEVELAYISLAKRGNVKARNLLFEKQLPALIDMASKTKYNIFKGNSAELVSSVLAIMDRAIELFEPARGKRFWTFLCFHAMSAMNKEMYGDNLVKLPENFEKDKKRAELASIESGYAPIQDGDEKTCLFDVMKGGDDAADIYEESLQGEYRDITGRLLAVLDREEAYVVSKCFLECEPEADGNPGNKPWSVSSLARHIGSSKEILARRRKKALEKLHAALDSDRDWCIDQAL
jgi:DNA-directed RNA polymerase sigma subunit (sigma70/sigma32)